jgi:CubicO group peptidase (beta-lactamase class C family)
MVVCDFVKNLRLGLVMLLVFLPLIGGAKDNGLQTAPNQRWTDAITKGRETIRIMMKRSQTPGVSVAVSIDGETVWQEGFGYSNLEHLVPVTPNTRFGIGSISKSLTTALVGRLMDEGLLDLDAPVEKYLPDFPHAGRGISTRLIASHLSGIDDRTERELYYTPRHFDTTQEAVKLLWKDPVVHEPRTQARYATGTYTIIAAVVEAVTGQSFLRAMKERVVEPLELSSTVPNERRQIIPHRTAFYELNDEGAIVHTPYFDPSFKWAGAGFLSTAEDLVRFGQAMMRPGFLSENTWKEITTPQRSVSGDLVFALGWDVFRDDRGRKAIAKSGGGPGIRGYLGIYPEHDLTVAILSNRSRAPIIEEAFSTVVDVFLQDSAPTSIPRSTYSKTLSNAYPLQASHGCH